jgi:hypothetical protein
MDPGGPPIPENVTPSPLYKVVKGVVSTKQHGAPVSKSIVVAKLLGAAQVKHAKANAGVRTRVKISLGVAKRMVHSEIEVAPLEAQAG